MMYNVVNCSAHQSWTILAIGFGVAAGVMSTTMLSIAFPDVCATFRISQETLQLRNILFFLVFAVGLAFFGFVAPRIGLRRQLLLGIGLFVVASIGSGLAPTWPVFVGFQVLQALADAMIVPAQLGLIRTVIPRERMGWAMSRFEAVLASATIGAPALGGLVTRHFQWQAIFGVLAMIAVIAWIWTRIAVPDLPRQRDASEPLPIINAVLLFATCFVATRLLSALGAGGPVTPWLGSVLVAGTAVVLFERHRDTPSLFPAEIRYRWFGVASIRIWLCFVAANALTLFGPSFLRDVHGLPEDHVGWILLCGAVVPVALVGLIGRVADQRPRRAIALSAMPVVAAYTLFGSVAAPAWIGWFIVATLILALGAAFVTTAQNTMVIRAATPSNASAVMGTFQLVQFSSGAFAAGLFGPLVSGADPGSVSPEGFITLLTISGALYLLAVSTLALDRPVVPVTR